jgi:hypothetical protein
MRRYNEESSFFNVVCGEWRDGVKLRRKGRAREVLVLL